MTVQSQVKGPLRWHGGKHCLAQRIINLMPPRAGDRPWHLYREPYAGGMSVLFRLDPEGLSEAVNDLDGQLINFWNVLRDPLSFAAFTRAVESTPFSEDLFYAPHVVPDAVCPSVHKAWAFFMRCRQSRQGLMKDFATPTRRLRRGMSENVSAWLTAVEGLPEVHARLKRVEIRNMDGIDFIQKYDDPEAVFYADPPYLHETRTVTDAYRHEMNEAQHSALLTCLARIEGRFLLSGYQNSLYDAYAQEYGWHRVEWDIDNKAGSGKTKQRRTECVWMNYKPEGIGD